MTNRILRLQKLNDLLKCHNGYTIVELMSLLDVEERTIRKDLATIQLPPYNASFASNLYRGRSRLYRYSDINYNLPLFNGRDEAKLRFNEAISLLSSLNTSPQNEWLKSCLLAIEDGGIDKITGIVSFENNSDLQGLEHLPILINAIQNRFPLTITYKPYDKDVRVVQVCPYHIKQYNNRWFLIGRPIITNVIHIYSLDRIISIKHLSKEYIESPIDFSEYFDDVIGVTVNDVELTEIAFLVSKKRYPYIRTKPLHWSQKHYAARDTEDYVYLTIEVKPNKELITLFLSFGTDLIVLSPENIRQSLLENIEQSYKAYQKKYNYE